MIEVRLTKYGGSLHRTYTMEWLGDDAHGTWLWARAGTQLIGPAGEIKYTIPGPTVRVIPHRAWWTAVFYDETRPYDVYCDITTPARWLPGGQVVLADLDLDLRRDRDGLVEFLDEDEFEANAGAMRYPNDVVGEARSCWQAVGRRLIDRDEPFGADFKRWFDAIGER